MPYLKIFCLLTSFSLSLNAAIEVRDINVHEIEIKPTITIADTKINAQQQAVIEKTYGDDVFTLIPASSSDSKTYTYSNASYG